MYFQVSTQRFIKAFSSVEFAFSIGLTLISFRGDGKDRLSQKAFGIACIALGCLWFVLCRHLSNEWSANEQYSYGWFVPCFAAYLFWLRWEERPEAANPKSQIPNPKFAGLAALAVTALFVLLPLRLFEVGNPDWRPLSWLHALLVAGLTILFLWHVGGAAWARHFAFPVCFILVAVPWVTPIEMPITQGLMRVVAAIASETANLCGIPAQLEGSVIRINSGVVGVNEACSGVRSLQTSLMIGLLFGELKRLGFGRRVLLVLGAVAIAFVANCGRAFFLVWIAATRNPEAVAGWHDVAGYAIVALVFIGTMALAGWLARGEIRNQKSEIRNPAVRLPLFYLGSSIAWLVLVELAVEGWYRWHERSLRPEPGWSVKWPEDKPGFRKIEIDENVARTLRFDRGGHVAWPIPASAPEEPAAHATLFFFRWEPGTATILRARSHRPDICLPAVGWRQTADHGVRSYAAGGDVALPFRHFVFASDETRRSGIVAHAFFSLREDQVPAGQATFDVGRMQTAEWDRDDRVRVVLEGLRNPGQQVLQLVLMGKSELTAEMAQSSLAKLLPELIVLRDH